jgi:hypothetical protein
MLEPRAMVWVKVRRVKVRRVKVRRVKVGRAKVREILRERLGDAFDDDAFGFEVSDAVFGAVAHVDSLL